MTTAQSKTSPRARLLDHSKTPKEDLTKEFRMFDRNNDGFIDKNELKVVLQKILPKFKLPDAEIQRMIGNIDKNNDGKIDYKGEWRNENTRSAFVVDSLH